MKLTSTPENGPHGAAGPEFVKVVEASGSYAAVS
jgi:hypothetical protein